MTTETSVITYVYIVMTTEDKCN